MHKIPLNILALSDISAIGLSVFRKVNISDMRGTMTIGFEGDTNFSIDAISIKESLSYKGVARGLHMQLPELSPQVKIIEVLEGSIYDFVYDIRSPSSIHCFKLDANDNTSVLIPDYFAHGFIALTDVRFRYSCLGRYDESNEVTYNFLGSASKALNIENIKLSKKDSDSPELFCEL